MLLNGFLARAAIAFLLLAAPALAQDKPLTDDEKKAIWAAADAASLAGPTDVPLGDQAKLHLADTFIFIPKAQAGELMRMWGNSVGDGFHGLVFAKSTTEQWVISIDHVNEGYVKDDDAKSWNADDLLQSLKDGTSAQNELRLKLGLPALEIVGWVQKPEYESIHHRLFWSVKAVDVGAAADAAATVNYNTYALGRDGYFTVNLMTTDKTVEQDKSAARSVVAAVDYNGGKSYADFKPDTDRVAEYGLAALIAGVAAKKLGLLAVVGVFVAKFAKIILAAVVVAGGGMFKFFRRKSE